MIALVVVAAVWLTVNLLLLGGMIRVGRDRLRREALQSVYLLTHCAEGGLVRFELDEMPSRAWTVNVRHQDAQGRLTSSTTHRSEAPPGPHWRLFVDVITAEEIRTKWDWDPSVFDLEPYRSR